LARFLADHAAAPEMVSAALEILGVMLLEAGQLAAARQAFQQTLAQATARRDSLGMVGSLVNPAIIDSREGTTAVALAGCQEAMRTAETAGEARGVQLAQSNMALTVKEVLWELVICQREQLPEIVAPYLEQGVMEPIVAQFDELVDVLAAQPN